VVVPAPPTAQADHGEPGDGERGRGRWAERYGGQAARGGGDAQSDHVPCRMAGEQPVATGLPVVWGRLKAR
jgi:hypothetical protein